jgi:hypothetical protein
MVWSVYRVGSCGDRTRKPAAKFMSSAVVTRGALLVALDSALLALEATLPRFPMGFSGFSI